MPNDPNRGLPLERFLLLPLDVTTPHEIRFPYYKEMVDPAFDSTASPSQPEGKPPIVHFTSSFFERTREVMIEFGKDAMELHDITAVWCAIENPPVREEDLDPAALPLLQQGWKAMRRKFDVERYVFRRADTSDTRGVPSGLTALFRLPLVNSGPLYPTYLGTLLNIAATP